MAGQSGSSHIDLWKGDWRKTQSRVSIKCPNQADGYEICSLKISLAALPLLNIRSKLKSKAEYNIKTCISMGFYLTLGVKK